MKFLRRRPTKKEISSSSLIKRLLRISITSKRRLILCLYSYFTDLASDLVLSETEKSSITTSISTIKFRLGLYFSDITEKKVFGSYIRGTILPRKADASSDIDIVVMFLNPNGYKPQTFLNRLKNFAEHYYSTSEIYQSNPTVVLELNHMRLWEKAPCGT